MEPGQITRAARFLEDLSRTSRDYAEAKGEYVRTEKWVSITLARLINQLRIENDKLSHAAAESMAKASVEYEQAVEGFSAATEKSVSLEWEMRIAQWRIELLRTQEASRRAEMQHLHTVT